MKKRLLRTIGLTVFKYSAIIVIFACFSLKVSAQNVSVSGVITGTDGKTVPGVTVLVKGTTNGTASDMEGKYTISVHPDSTLVFTFIGFKSQIVPVASRTEINVVMSDDSELLDEVIVIGYGSIKKSHLTGSVSKVEAKVLDEIPVSRVDDAMIGQVSGVNIQQTNPAVGEAPAITVRGQGSISFNSYPLIVLDGIVVGNDGDYLASLDMNDIESIEILKDASSGAIYGSRGANGIIMITTKKGVEGPTTFSYNGFFGWKDVPKNDVLTTPNDWINWVESNGLEVGDKLQYVEQMGTYTDWEEVIFDGGMINSHSLSAKGGTKNTKFQASMSYLNDEGVLLTDNYEKINFRINVTTKLRERLQFGINVNPSYTDQQRFPIGIHDAVSQSPWLPVYLDEESIDYVNRYREDGRWEDAQIGDYAMERMFDDYDLVAGMPDPNSSGTYISTTSNQGAFAKILERDRKKSQTKVYANTFLQFDLNDNFFLKQTFGGDFRFTKNTTWVGVEASRNGALDTESYRTSQIRWHYVSESTANFKKEFGGSNIAAVVGFAFENWKTEDTNLESAGFSNDLIQTIPAANVTGGYMEEYEENLISYLARLNYDYRDRYLISASIRTDGSSKFGPDSKYGWFPAISAGWIISKESFFRESSFLSVLKLRASYGVTGNNNGIGPYDHLGLISPVGTGFGSIGYNATNIANPELGWEKLLEFNPGIDASFFSERITLSFDWYIRKSQNLLLNVPIPSVTGFETALVNQGEVENRGFEIELRSRNISSKNFSWNTSVIVSRNKNILVNFADADGLITTVDDKRPAEWIAQVGNPISSFYGYVVEKEIPLEYINDPSYPINSQSQDIYVKDLNGDGVIDTDDRTILGSPYPDVVWSVTNSFKYKNFDFTFMFQGSHGAEVRNISSQYIKNEYASNMDYIAGFADADLVEERIYTSDDIQDASYVSLRTLNLGYSFSPKLLSKAGIRKLRVYFAGSNLLYIMADDYVGYNPEGIDQGLDSPLTYGYQRGPAPIYRTYSFGVNLDF